MRRFLRVSVILGVVVVIGSGVLVGCLYRATQQAPAFYQAALQAPPEIQKEAGDELERRVLDLRNELRNEGRFDVQFTHDQINGWLAADLPEKFPQLMPRGVSDPRLAFEPDLTRVACKYQDSRISAVVSLDADVYLTEDPTVVAVRLKQVRAGSLPIPLGQFLDQISRHATAAGLPLQWSETEGDPLALVTIPPLVDERANALLHLEAIEVLDGKVRFAGRTEPLSTERPGNGINYRQAAGGQKVKRTTQL
jgi:hypothetical protein